MIGDFGRDLNKEKALAQAIALRRLGLIGALSVVANSGDCVSRARLAKGTANVLGAHDVQVAAGAAGASTGHEHFEFEVRRRAAVHPSCFLLHATLLLHAYTPHRASAGAVHGARGGAVGPSSD